MRSLALIFATLLLGLAVRFAPLGLPQPVTKYGGSALWALMIYWIVAALLRARSPITAGLVTWLLTTAVELFKLVHTPTLDRFRLSLAGILLLGRFFSVTDLVAYAAAILAGVLVDRHLRARQN